MTKLLANRGDPDLTPHYAASNLGLHCLPITLLQVSRLQWVKNTWKFKITLLLKPATKLLANSGDPDQMQHSAGLIWVCTVCQLPFYKSPDYNGLRLLENKTTLLLRPAFSVQNVVFLVILIYIHYQDRPIRPL